MANAIMFDDSVDLSNYVDLTSNQDISGAKRIIGGAPLYFVNTGRAGVIFCANDAFNLVLRSDNQNITFRCAQIIPYGNSTASLGSDSYMWKNLFLSGILSDGTNSITIANIGSKPIQDTAAPLTSTAADYLGQEYIDTTSGDMYRCTAITPQGTTPETYSYTWRQLAFVV